MWEAKQRPVRDVVLVMHDGCEEPPVEGLDFDQHLFWDPPATQDFQQTYS